MIQISTNIGSKLDYVKPILGMQVAKELGMNDAVGIRVGERLCDLTTVLDRNCAIKIVTKSDDRGRVDADAFCLLQHSAAHVAAEAISKVFPEAKLVYGPPTDDGFYYDIDFGKKSLSASDFARIEAEMGAIIREDRPFTRYELPPDEAMEKLRREGSKFKLDNAARALADDPNAVISFYATGRPGKDFEDLCRGPHLPSTGSIGAIKLLSLASSYWKGDANLGTLTRVYGRAAFSREELDQYLAQREAAKERDHRIVGKKLKLFATDDEVGQGLILWTPAGAIIRRELEIFIAEELSKRGYSQVYSPHIGRLDLYRKSGHFPYYKDSQYPPIIFKEAIEKLAQSSNSCGELANLLIAGDQLDGYLLKPMNCPHHIKIYASQPRSYRELPIRLAEFGTVYRWEKSGEVGGLTRVRGFTQDDAHLFCTENQVPREIEGCLDLVKLVLGKLGIGDYRVRIGLRDPASDKYTGESAAWDKAEEACRKAAKQLGVDFTEEIGEAAFYGPKIDFVVRDVIGRDWQLGTVQCDYNLPQRFDLTYIGDDNQPHRPVMIHRAPFGSMERFVGVLIEHFNGAFPTWLAPEQVRVLTVHDSSATYAESVHSRLAETRIRSTLDVSSDRIQAKIRRGLECKVPYLLIVGPRNQESATVNIRVRDLQKDIGEVSLTEFLDKVGTEIRERNHATFAQ